MNKNTNFDKENIFGKGNENVQFSKYFIGKSYLNMLTQNTDGVKMANVTFEPGCRNNWHIHKATKGGGQILLCIAGSGWYQEENQKPISLNPGMVIVIKPNVKHWHGAKCDSYFSHIAVEVDGENTQTEWLEAVTDEEYSKLGSK